MPALARDQYLRRLDIVENMIQDGELAFTIRPFGRTHADYVRFDEFATMALRLNWMLPSAFPGRPDRPPPGDLRVPRRGSASTVTVLANTRCILLKLTKRQPTASKRARGLDQQALAVKIDVAFGRNPREGGTPSPEAVALATAIRACEDVYADRPADEPVRDEHLHKVRTPRGSRTRRRPRRSAQA
ncbi:MAG TPA: hypothetical protein VIU64_11900 [Polyangia bacterium]